MKKILYVSFVTILLFAFAACEKAPATTKAADGLEADDSLAVTKAIEEEPSVPERFKLFPEETNGAVSPPVYYSVYVPNDNADGFDVETAFATHISVETVLAELKERTVLPDAVAVNHFHMDNGLITLDFNSAFADVVCSMGTSGEFMVVGSVVNTFLDAFQAEYVSFTVNGQTLETGHTIYDFAMPFFSTDW